MSYLNTTYDRVVSFLKSKKKVFITELQYLGGITMQVKRPTLDEILEDLEWANKIKVTQTVIGGKTFTEIKWRGKK